MPKFVQIVEFESKNIDEHMKIDKEWEAAAQGQSLGSRSMVCADRDNPGRYFVIVEFPSYEDAQKNNELPVTQEFSQRHAAVDDTEPRFVNLDVITEADW